MKHNPDKTVSANRYGLTISYTDTCKHYNVTYEKQDDNVLKELHLKSNNFKKKSQQNENQKKVYRIALYGLSVFTPEEISNMTFLEKSKITNNQKKVQRFLDEWKQEICHRKVGSFLLKFLKHSEEVKNSGLFKLATFDYYDRDNKNKMEFRDLGINRDMIVKKLILADLLPHNYYELI